jgi:hypothetical protein
MVLYFYLRCQSEHKIRQSNRRASRFDLPFLNPNEVIVKLISSRKITTSSSKKYSTNIINLITYLEKLFVTQHEQISFYHSFRI